MSPWKKYDKKKVWGHFMQCVCLISYATCFEKNDAEIFHVQMKRKQKMSRNSVLCLI